jgi:hypothetical protein
MLDPGRLANLSLLVLDSRDLEKTTPEEWLALTSRVIIATPGADVASTNQNNWLTTHPQCWYAVITDGDQMWIERK